MKVLLITFFYPPEIGAPALRVQAMTQAFVRRGWEVEVLTGLPQYPFGRRLQSRGHRIVSRETLFDACVYRVPTYPTQRLGLRRFASYMSHAIGTAVAGTLLRRDWDVVLVESPPLFVGLPGLWLSAASGARLALDVTDVWPDSARELGLVTNGAMLRLAKGLERHLYRRAWRISCATRGIARYIGQQPGIDASRVDVLFNGVDPEMFHPARAESSPPPVVAEFGRRKVFTYAGLIGTAQALTVIVGAAKRLNRERGIGFLIMGDGPAREDLLREIESEHLDNLRLVAAQSGADAARVLAHSYASIVPLRRLPLMSMAVPSKVITSLATGTPVLLCGAGEAAELLLQHRCGIAVEPESPEALADAVRSLAVEPERRNELAENGLALVREAYDWKRITDDWLDRWLISPSGENRARH